MSPLLAVDDLRVRFTTDQGIARAVDGISFSLSPGETLCIVGESGCGKSVTALSVMGLVACPPGEVSGRITFEGRRLLELGAAELSDLRGDRLAMIFQEPMTALNPAFTIGWQLAEVLIRHRGMSKREARAAAIEMLKRVRIPAAEDRFDEYAHRLSGGMRQRVMIAMALLCSPALLIADEPTTALDVTIQAQVLDLMRRPARGNPYGDHADHARPRRRRRDGRPSRRNVCGRNRRGGKCDGPLRDAAASLYRRPARGDSRTRRTQVTPDRDRRSRPERDRVARRLPVRAPLSVRDARCRRETPPAVRIGDGHVSRCWKAPLEALAA